MIRMRVHSANMISIVVAGCFMQQELDFHKIIPKNRFWEHMFFCFCTFGCLIVVLPGKKNVVQYALTENASNGGTLCPTQPTSRAIFRGAYGVKHDTAVKVDPSCFIALMDRIWYVYTLYTYVDIRIRWHQVKIKVVFSQCQCQTGGRVKFEPTQIPGEFHMMMKLSCGIRK